jgi:exodeoxyribonuclease VII small subunit
MVTTGAKALETEGGGEPAFEEILSRLTSVVDQLETGELPLAKSLELFEEGVSLSRQGSERLDEAEHRIERLLNASGETEVMSHTDKETDTP